MSSKVACKYCSVLIEDYRVGDKICSDCGPVFGDRVIDVGSEWRTFSNDTGGEDKSRVGGAENTLLGSSDLGTVIEGRYRNGRQSTSEKNLLNAFRTISDMADRIHLTKTITDRAKVLFEMVYDGKNLKGHSHDTIATACLYIACKQEGVPRTFTEIVAVSTVTKKEIGRCFKLILNAHDTSMDLITTGDFMSRFCGTLSLSREVQKAATCIAKKAVDLDIVPGRSPISVAAAAIYMASQVYDDLMTYDM